MVLHAYLPPTDRIQLQEDRYWGIAGDSAGTELQEEEEDEKAQRARAPIAAATPAKANAEVPAEAALRGCPASQLSTSRGLNLRLSAEPQPWPVSMRRAVGSLSGKGYWLADVTAEALGLAGVRKGGA